MRPENFSWLLKVWGLNSADVGAIVSGKTEKFRVEVIALTLLDVIERY